MLNILTIHAIRKTSLPKPLKSLLLSLAVSDIGFGLFCQPLHVVFLVGELEQNTGYQTYNTLYIAWPIMVNLFIFASFFDVIALSADRFLAIHLHLRYQELVTHKSVVAVVILIWLFSAFLALSILWIPGNIPSLIAAVVMVACLLTVNLLNFKIYLAVRRHSNQIHALQVQQTAQNEEMVNGWKAEKICLCYSLCLFSVFGLLFAANLCYISISYNLSTKYRNTGFDPIH